MELKKILFCVKVCRKSKKPLERNVPLSTALPNVAQITDSVTQLLGPFDVMYSFEDMQCQMVMSSSVLQELVDKALEEKSAMC